MDQSEAEAVVTFARAHHAAAGEHCVVRVDRDEEGGNALVQECLEHSPGVVGETACRVGVVYSEHGGTVFRAILTQREANLGCRVELPLDGIGSKQAAKAVREAHDSGEAGF